MKDWKDKLRPEDFPVHTTDKEKRFRNIKSRIGALIGQETEISEKDIFITEFSPDDVNYFIKLLRENRPGETQPFLKISLSGLLTNGSGSIRRNAPMSRFSGRSRSLTAILARS